MNGSQLNPAVAAPRRKQAWLAAAAATILAAAGLGSVTNPVPLADQVRHPHCFARGKATAKKRGKGWARSR